jgi:hypothetical protein|tara:strand:+ start:142 stop:834 length:693 start_codon:yes stop_codon:yes gene_type:complete
MANRIPHHFLEAPKETLSVNFTDFATGKGIVDFFFGTVAGSNRLSETAWYSDLIFKPGTVSVSATANQSLDEDFDVDFIKSVTIEGDAIATICWAIRNDEVYNSPEVYPIVKIRKWDGSTETDIVSVTGTSKFPRMDSISTLATDIFSLKLTIPKTNFKKGESLRVSVELWQKSNGTSDMETIFLCDPMGRLKHAADINQETWGHDSNHLDLTSTAGAVTISKIQIPFRI